jgi:hypothetical protein
MTPEVGFYPYTKAVLILFFFRIFRFAGRRRAKVKKFPDLFAKNVMVRVCLLLTNVIKKICIFVKT